MRTKILKNGKKLVIRQPKVEDAKSIIEYLNQIGGESDFLLFGKNEFKLSIDQEKQYIENINSQQKSIILIGFINNEIVATSQITSPSRERIAHTCELGISVKKDYWGIGVGGSLMESLIEFAKNTNEIKVINLKVNINNTSGISLYKKFGFEEIGLYKMFTQIDGEFYDSIIMNLYI